MSIELIAALKHLSTFVGAIRSAGTVKSWLAGDPDSPITVAVRATVRRFESRFPNIANQLNAFLGAESTQEALTTAATRVTPDLSPLAADYVRITDLYVSPAEPAEPAASEILRFLLEELDRQLLAGKSDVALTHHERKSESRYAVVEGYLARSEAGQANITATLEQIVSRLAEPADEQVSRFKELHKDDPLPEARIAWSVFDGSTHGPGFTSRARADVTLERASLALQLGYIAEATALFRRAFEQDPTHPRAQRNRALGLALEGDVEGALSASEALCRREPSNELFATTRAHVLHISGRDEDVVALVEPRVASRAATPDARRALIVSLVRLKRFDHAVAIADDLAKEDPVLGTFAVEALAHAARAEHRIHSGVFTAEVTSDLEHAASAYARCIPLARQAGKAREAVEYMTSRASALMALERSDEAREQAFEAFRLDAESREVAITTANISLISGRPELALTVAEKLASQHDDEAVAIVAAAYAGVNRSASYGGLAEYVRRYTDLSSASYLTIDVLVQKAIAVDSLEDVEQLLSTWQGEHLKKLLVRARVLAARHEFQSAVQLLSEALSLAPTPPDVFTIARLAHSCGDLNVALRAFELLAITSSTPSFIVGPYLNVLLERRSADDEEKILLLASEARREGRIDVPLLHAEAVIRELRHDVEGAKTDWEELATRAPGDRRYQLAVARCEYRLGSIVTARRVLDALDRRALEPRELLMAAELDRRVGEPHRAIRTGFAAWKKGRKSADVLFAYVSLFFMIPERDKPWLNADEVTDGVIVKLAFSTGDERSFYVGQSDEDLGLDRLSADSEGGRRVLGRRVDDMIEWGTVVGGSKVTAKVLAITRPEVYAAQTAIETAPLMFPGTSPIAKLTIGEDAAELKEHLRRARETTESAIEFAKTRDLPFGTLVRLFGRNAFETWGSLALTGVAIFSNQNTIQETSAESADLKRAGAVVLDTLTLLTLGALNWNDRLSARFARVLVPQRTYDELHECRQRVEEARARGGAKSMHYEEGRLIGTTTPPEVLASQSEFLGKLLAFCEQHCQRLGEPRTYSSFERNEMADVIGPACVDAMLIAESREAERVALYSDDAVVRLVARERYGIMAFSTNALLMADHEARLIDDAAYADAMRLLLTFGYRRLTIRVVFLDFLVLGMRPVTDYAAASDELFRKGADRGVTLRVIVTHLRSLVVGAPVWELVLKYLDILLAKISSVHGTAGIRFLRTAVPVKDRLIIVPNEKRLDALLKQWEDVSK
ncbi:GreA/GreB family elongation factor [Anaeromyxobacter sp. PSR-1]|uniref:PIN domain-containing protein n=1 Tax=Anaeromyxobacter sp. PSR-1 TaxID=1300915 RepID=UPI0005E42C09|nr:GreA/GreB family elongation factor [Anaeromyxobacter sp. PSR-1]GAO01448.1 tetratricopeptide repeat protein [Anaeromyxobacter sp. PSR-1]